MNDDLIVHGERWRRDPDHPRFWSYVLQDDAGDDVLVDVKPGEMPLLDEIEALRRWKAEATHVLSQWDDVWQAAGSPGPLGTSNAAAVRGVLDRLREKAERTKIEGWIVLIYEHGQPTVNWDSTVHLDREAAEAEARAAGRQGWAADVAALQVHDPYGYEHEKRRIHWRDLGVPKTDYERAVALVAELNAWKKGDDRG